MADIDEGITTDAVDMPDDDSKRLEMPFGHAEEEVKGPDAKVWGDDVDRPPAEAQTVGAQLVGQVGDDGEAVKGPDPEQHPQ